MARQIMTVSLVLAAVCGFIFVVGCQNDAQTGSAVGALAGAGIGQLAGRNAESTLIGAAVGGGAGYILGNEADKQKQQAQLRTMQNDMNSAIVNVTNSNGSIVQVRLRRRGVGWVGTRGEYYPTLPTSEQLRPVYGF